MPYIPADITHKDYKNFWKWLKCIWSEHEWETTKIEIIDYGMDFDGLYVHKYFKCKHCGCTRWKRF